MDLGIQQGIAWMIQQRASRPAINTAELLVCRCRHTGDFRVITRASGNHCHKCNPETCQPMTRACVQGAFNFLAEELRTMRGRQAAALARERWIGSLKITDAQRDWLSANPEYDLVDPTTDGYFPKVGTLYMHGVFEEGTAFMRLAGTLGVGIKRTTDHAL